MKKLISILTFTAVMAGFVSWFARTPQKAQAPVAETPAALPPLPTAQSRFPAVNQQRLHRLEASNYKGPSYKTDYNTPEILQASKKKTSSRVPASQ